MPTPLSTMTNSQHRNYMSDNEHDDANDDANKYDKYRNRNPHAYAIERNDEQPTSELHKHNNANDDANKYNQYRNRNPHAYAIKHNDEQLTLELHIRQLT